MPPLHEGWFTGAAGQPVFHRWALPDAPRASVLVLHGYAEHSGRYAHVLSALADQGLAAFAPDHRGHGRSARVRGDIEDVERVLSDLVVLHRLALQHAPGRPVFLLAHSLGAVLALRYLQRHGDSLAGAVLNGTAVKVRHASRPAVLVARLMQRAWPTLPVKRFFDPTRGSRDPAVWETMRTDPLQYRGRIRARTGWQILRTIDQALADLDRVRCPVLLTHGENDLTVPLSASEGLRGALSHPDTTLHVFPGLRHEVHQEPEKDEVIGTWARWILHRAEAERQAGAA